MSRRAAMPTIVVRTVTVAPARQAQMALPADDARSDLSACGIRTSSLLQGHSRAEEIESHSLSLYFTAKKRSPAGRLMSLRTACQS